MRAERAGALPPRCRASRSTPARIAPGEAFFAIKGDNRDGHDFVAGRARGRRRACGRCGRQARSDCRRMRRCWSCPTCSMGCATLARAARARSQAKIIGVTGSVGKTGTKEALRLALGSDGRDPCLGRLLQQSLGRAAVARALSADGALRRVRDRHEPCRRDRAADAPGASACGDHHHDRAGASRILRLARGDRRRQGRNLPRPRAGRRGGDQSRQSAIRAAASAAQGAPASSASSPSASTRSADARLVKCSLQPDCSTVRPAYLGDRCHLQARRAGPASRAQLARGARGRLARRRRSRARGAGARRAAARDRARRAHHARNAGRHGAADRRELQRQSGLDARGARAARPGRDRGARPAHRGARRHAGARAARRRPASRARGRGPRQWRRSRLLLRAADARLWEALPSERRGGYAETSAALEPQVLAAIQPGDAVMVKGSLGSRMGPIVKALQGRYRREALAAAEVSAAQVSTKKADPCSIGSPHSPTRSGPSTCSATSRSAPAAR